MTNDNAIQSQLDELDATQAAADTERAALVVAFNTGDENAAQRIPVLDAGTHARAVKRAALVDELQAAQTSQALTAYERVYKGVYETYKRVKGIDDIIAQRAAELASLRTQRRDLLDALPSTHTPYTEALAAGVRSDDLQAVHARYSIEGYM